MSKDFFVISVGILYIAMGFLCIFLNMTYGMEEKIPAEQVTIAVIAFSAGSFIVAKGCGMEFCK